eukprot:1585604-Prymnesium_polylepis.1
MRESAKLLAPSLQYSGCQTNGPTTVRTTLYGVGTHHPRPRTASKNKRVRKSGRKEWQGRRWVRGGQSAPASRQTRRGRGRCGPRSRPGRRRRRRGQPGRRAGRSASAPGPGSCRGRAGAG